jgi:WD40 repeat protein
LLKASRSRRRVTVAGSAVVPDPNIEAVMPFHAVSRRLLPTLTLLALLAPASPAVQEATAVDALGDPLPAGAIARLGTRRLRCDAEATGVVFSDDGKRVRAVDIQGVISEWDAKDGRLLQRFDAGRPPVWSLSQSADGSRIALLRDASGASVLDGASGQQLLDLERYGTGSRISLDGRWIAVWGQPFSKVSLLDGQGQPVHDLNENVREFYSVAFSRDGNRIAMVGRRVDEETREKTAVLSVCDTATGEAVFRQEFKDCLLMNVTFAADGARVVCGDNLGRVRAWDAATGKLVRGTEGVERTVRGLSFSPDGRLLAETSVAMATPETGVGRNAFTLRDGETFEVVRQIAGHHANISMVAFTPDSQRMASACRDHLIRLWDATTGARLLQPAGHDTGIAAMAASADGALLLTAGDDGRLGLWNGHTWSLQEMVDASISPQLAVACTADGKLAATSALDGGTLLWSPADAAVRGGWPGAPAQAAYALAFASDGRTLASAEADGKVRLRDVGAALEAPIEAGSEPALALAAPELELDTGGAVAFTLAFSPDSKVIAVASSRLRLYDVASGKMLHDIKGTSPIGGLAFSPDGSLIASADADRSVRVYATADGALRGTLKGHMGRVRAVAFSRDGRLLASASDTEPDVRLWDVEHMAPAGQLAGHVGGVNALLSLQPDLLASASPDGVVLVWRLPAPAAPGG